MNKIGVTINIAAKIAKFSLHWIELRINIVINSLTHYKLKINVKVVTM